MRFIELGHDIFTTMDLMEKPVIAAVKGIALGGGVVVAVVSDMRFASETAMFGMPEINLGLILDWTGRDSKGGSVGRDGIGERDHYEW